MIKIVVKAEHSYSVSSAFKSVVVCKLCKYILHKPWPVQWIVWNTESVEVFQTSLKIMSLALAIDFEIFPC